jgi:hypothetical protein
VWARINPSNLLDPDAWRRYNALCKASYMSGGPVEEVVGQFESSKSIIFSIDQTCQPMAASIPSVTRSVLWCGHNSQPPNPIATNSLLQPL